MKSNIVKGFRDIENASKRIAIRNIIEETFKLYNFQAVETPIIEYEEFVKSGNEGDEVISDVFKLQDKGKRKLALRYEFTFQLKRLAKNKKLPFRIYQVGPVFRDEPITGNRFRQFTQCDADVVGSSVKDEAEILKLSSEILNKLNIKFTININNRKFLGSFLRIYGLEDESKIKQVMIALDKLDKKSKKDIRKELDKIDKKLGDYFTKLVTTTKNLSDFKKLKNYYKGICMNKKINYNETLFKEAEEEKKELEKYCKLYKIPIKFQGFLARGLSYYNGTVFEIKGGLKETIAAGGSYLVNNVPATGISFGLDRLELLAKMKLDKPKVLVISINQDKKAIEICDKVRKLNLSCQIYYGRPGRALEYANSLKIGFVVFVGREEVKKGKVKVRDMKTGKERLVGEKELGKVLMK